MYHIHQRLNKYSFSSSLSFLLVFLYFIYQICFRIKLAVLYYGFPGGLAGIESAMKASWVHFLVGKIPWRRKRQHTPVLLPGKSHGLRSLAGYSPQGCKESDTTEVIKHTYIRKQHIPTFKILNAFYMVIYCICGGLFLRV